MQAFDMGRDKQAFFVTALRRRRQCYYRCVGRGFGPEARPYESNATHKYAALS